MLNLIKPCNDEKIIRKYIQTFIFEDKFRDFSLQHHSVRVYASDFFIEPNKVRFSDILIRLSSMQNSCFYIVWMLSTIYKETFIDTMNIGVISKEDLIKLMLKQKQEMQNDCLVFVNDLSETDFWDLMIFDESFTWSCVLTHEDDFDGKRICYYLNQSWGDQSGKTGGKTGDGSVSRSENEE